MGIFGTLRKRKKTSEKEYVVSLCWFAARYAKLGWKMIPLHGIVAGGCTCKKGSECKAPGKHPRPFKWQEKATSDVATVHKWIDNLGAKMNLGVATGEPSGISVLDVDIDKKGLESLEQLEDQFNPIEDTLRAITGGDGAHIILKNIPGRDILNKVKILPGLDIRDKGGLIVVAPSRHRSGGTYRWANDLDKTEIIEYPNWLVDIIDGKKTTRFDFDKWIARQDPSVEGENGSAQCMRVAAKAVRAAKIRSLELFLVSVREWNASCEPPWSREELAHKFEDALQSWKEEGRAEIPVNQSGEYRAGYDTLVQILREDSLFCENIKYNEATKEIYRNGEALGSKGVNLMRFEIMTKYNHMPTPKEDLIDASLLVAHENSFNPIRDYLRGLKWDGKARLMQIPRQILGVQSTPLNKAYLKKFFIGCVARVMQPGCKLDTVLVLKGRKQGTYKSTFFKVLAEPWFVDSQMDLRNKDSYGIMAKAWIYEWGEIENIYSSREVSRIKAFLGSSEDVYREPYGRVTETHPRITVFVGSTNKDDILHDDSGSRRFWVIVVGDNQINIKLLKRWRNQLWAEAFALYESGQSWWLSKDMEAKQGRSNQLHQMESPLRGRVIETATRLIVEGKKRLSSNRRAINQNGPIGFTINELARRMGIDLVRNVQVQREITSILFTVGYRQRLTGKHRVRTWFANTSDRP